MRKGMLPSGSGVGYCEVLVLLTCVFAFAKCADIVAPQKMSTEVPTSAADKWNIALDSGSQVIKARAKNRSSPERNSGGAAATPITAVGVAGNNSQDTVKLETTSDTNDFSQDIQRGSMESKEVAIVSTESMSNFTPSVADTSTDDQMTTVSDETGPTTERPKRSKFVEEIRRSLKRTMASMSAGLTRQLLQADISADCLIGILHFTRALGDFEPWALRLIDATAKYPTGLFQMNTADLGAYDECIETVARNEHGEEVRRGQYCNVRISATDKAAIADLLPAVVATHPKAAKFTEYAADERLARLTLGVCFIDACSAADVESIGRTLLGSTVALRVSNCVTDKKSQPTTTQVSIIIVLAVLAALVVAATTLECFTMNWDNARKDATLYRIVIAFSVLRNTKIILSLNDDKNSASYSYRFLHGLRVLSVLMVSLGHSYVAITESTGRLINALEYNEHWPMMLVYAGFLAVDTFFFMSGFLLYYILSQYKERGILFTIFAIFRRFIRCTIPLFFVLMCMHLLPLLASGPSTQEFYSLFYAQFQKHWWDWLIQIHNWRQDASVSASETTMFHLWYLSTDFQLFVVALIVIQTCGPKKFAAASCFAVLSLICCTVSAWQVYGTNMTPFVVLVHESFDTVMNTAKFYYPLPFYHGVCLFSGCMASMLVEKYGKAKISSVVQSLLWLVALVCGLYSVFIKIGWYRNSEPVTEAVRLFYAFANRAVWSACLAWIVFACATRRGGVICTFLSWKAFVPLSRLSFGVYLIHYPFYFLMHHASRERILYSHFTLINQFTSVTVWSYILSYFLFIACDAPTGNLDKLVFMQRRRNIVQCTSATQKVSNEDKSMSVCCVGERCESGSRSDATNGAIQRADKCTSEKGWRL